MREWFRNRIGEPDIESEVKAAESKLLSSMSSYMGCYQKVWSSIRLGLLTLNDLIKKNTLQVCYLFGF